MGRSVDNVGNDAMDSVIAAWRGDPRDRRAVAGVRAGLLARYANAIQSGAPGVGELARAASNLLDRIREGTVEPNVAVVDALADAASRMGDPEGTRDNAIDHQVERLDAYASGLTELEFDDAPTPGNSVRDDPPLLTVRHDGVRVTPGSFEAAADASETHANELPILVDAWEAIGDCIRSQLASLRAVAEKDADPELRRLVSGLQGATDTIERLNRTLAEYARRVGE